MAVLQYLDDVSPDARLMGAVNTVRRDGDRLIGENTDGKGFLRALRDDAARRPQGQDAWSCSGPAAPPAPIASELALAGASPIEVVNRTPGPRPGRWSGCSTSTRPSTATFVAVDVGCYRVPTDRPAGQLLRRSASTPTSTAFPTSTSQTHRAAHGRLRRHSQSAQHPAPPRRPPRGAKTIDGLGMLVYQGAIAFKMWTGYDAPVDVMHHALAEVLGL